MIGLNILKRKTFKNIGLYTTLNLFNAIIPFLLLPILTRHLSKEEYGIIDLFNNLGYILIPIVGLNIGASVIRYYYDKDKLDLSKFIFNVILFLTVFGIVLIAAAFLGGSIYSDLLTKSGIPPQLLYLSVAYALFSQIGEVLLSLWRAEENPMPFGIFRISKTGIDLGVSIYLIVFINMGWQARVYTAVVVAILFSILAIFLMVKYFKVKAVIDYGYMKIALQYSAPLILHNLGGYIIGFSDRFVILHFMDLKAVGLYAVAYQVGMIMSFLNNSFNQAWTPLLFSKLASGSTEVLRKLHKVNYYYFLLMILMSVGIYVFVPLIYKIFIGRAFNVDPIIVFWILLGYAINGMYKMMVNYMFYYKRTGKLAIITFLSAIFNVVFCWILIPKYGILGAAIATTIAFALMFGFVYIDYLTFYNQQKNKITAV